MKTLFKRDSKNKIRSWVIITDGDQLIQSSGILDSKKMVSHTKTCKPKNVGKSNETSGSEQAILEMESLIKFKLTEGYFETKEQAENELVILPVLAKDYKEHYKKVDWNNTFIQRKYDGMRALAHCKSDGSVVLISRDGKIIENMQHIIDDLSNVKENVIFDGELWTEGSFQDNMKLIKKYRKGESEKIKYNIYDIISDECFDKRSDILYAYWEFNDFESISFVETIKCSSELEMKEFHQKFISEGFEGTMVRTGLSGYQINKRSDSLLKYKDFIDIDAEIIDILPNDANPLHGTPLLKYSNQKMSGKSESIFRAGVKMSHEDRADLLTNKDKYIGKLANIRFFEWTDDGNPRFPVMIGIHEDR